MNTLPQLEKILGYQFHNTALLEEAVTHPSRGHELHRKIRDNQRLEFLGDAVLQLVLTKKLFQQFKNFDEGWLTRLRAAVVNRNALENMALTFSLGQFLVLGHGEIKNRGRVKSSNLADAMEAVIGAIFMDSDFETVTGWLEPLLNAFVEKQKDQAALSNPKGVLQELLQAAGKGAPEYILDHEEGPDHAKIYQVSVHSGEATLGRGVGNSKKAAEIAAAADALEQSSTQKLS
ncbi:MAG: ribonuclease III [Verrucomicrobiales bacterium]|jgi:ribonuclease-3|nr:ribonuclease III [Verrucomicrobiales bacterium]